MTSYNVTDDMINDAERWFKLVNSETASDVTRSEFKVWFEEKPAHQHAYAQIFVCNEDRLAFSEFFPTKNKALRGTATVAIGQIADDLNSKGYGGGGFGVLTTSVPFSYKIMAVAALFCVAILSFSTLMETPKPIDYTTQVAEVRKLVLDDGSTVMLGASSHITVEDFSGAERRVTLVKGEALFDVIHNPEKSFIVKAGETNVQVLGTIFNLNRTDDYLAVSLLEGKLDVKQDGFVDLPWSEKSVGNVTLYSEQQVSVNNGVLEQPEPRKVEKMANWVEGRLNYVDVPLHVVIADVNRYSRLPVRITNEELGKLPVTAVFGVDQIGVMIKGLEHILPVMVTRGPEGSYMIRPKDTV